MLLDVSDLRRQKGSEKDFTGRDSQLELELQGDLFVFNEVLVKGHAANVSGKIYVKGSIEAIAGLTCSRCLASFTIPVTAVFEETYYAADGVDEGNPDDNGRIYSGEKIDLRDVIIESLVLVMPMKPICHPDCQGLCPSCGCNLNIDQCSCSPRAPDPRLAGLGEILKNMQD